ncbi:hypothetical protein RYX36_019878, partial [Vicia faba]
QPKLVSGSPSIVLLDSLKRVVTFNVLDLIHQCTSLLLLNTFVSRFWNLLVTLQGIT